MRHETIIRSMSGLCTSGTSQDIQLDTWPYDTQILWQRVVGIALVDTPDMIRVGLKRGGELYVARADKPGGDGRSIETKAGVEASGDYVPCARFEGATVGKTLQLFAFGAIVSRKGVPEEG